MMNQLKPVYLFVALLLSSNSAWSVNILECEDEQGNRSFQKHCPPGSKSLAEKHYSNKTASAETALPALVLYTVPDCAVCDEMREDLAKKNIAVTEKNIKDDGELQLELKTKTGGDPRVPVLLIGDKVIAGYDAQNLTTALTEAGYLAKEIDNQ